MVDHAPVARLRPALSADQVHKIKHDGFRVVARKDGGRARLHSRPRNDLTCRLTLIVEALA